MDESRPGPGGKNAAPPFLSVVLPVYNEKDNLDRLMVELRDTLEGLGLSWEVLFVDDGSSDGSLEGMKKIRAENANVRIIRHRRNLGQSAAMATGFRMARGDVIATMDADLQNDPADLPLLMAKLDGADVVIGWRRERKDTLVKKMSSRIANGIRNWMTDETVHDTGCSLKVFRSEFVRRTKLFDGMHRFLPTLMKLEGARVEEVKVRHRPRTHGLSKYGLANRLLGPFLDLLAVRWMQKRYIPDEAEEVE